MHGVRYDKRGFTLIELLVVMAIIAVFLGILGMALSRSSNPTMASQGGQRTISGLVTGARAQAILKQGTVRLIVHNDPPLSSDSVAVQQEKRERYLRYLGIVVLDTDDNGDLYWKAVNEGVYLPRGVYIVPPRQYYLPNGDLTDPLPEVISDAESDWAWSRRSVVARLSDPLGIAPARETDDYQFNSEHPPQNYFHIQFNSRGMIDGSYPNIGRLIVAPARETRTMPNFENEGDSYALGGVFRRYGSITMVNDSVAFPDLE